METNNYESIKEKLKKLSALAERGVNGEAENAKRAIERICAQYDIKLEDILDSNTVKTYRFKIGRGKLDITLFVQCYAKITGEKSLKYHQHTRDTITTELTPLQAAELNCLFQWHKENFKKEMEQIQKDLMEAYISKHRIYRDKSEDDDDDEEQEELTPEEMQRLWKLMQLRETFSDRTYQKQLETKND